MVWVILAGALLLWLPPSTLSMRNSLKINPKPCSVNNIEGRCMFVWECINTDGHHLGMCVDTFMFGSCCAHNNISSSSSQLSSSSTTTELVTQYYHNNNKNTEPTILYTKPSHYSRPSQYTRPSQQQSSTSQYSRPSLSSSTTSEYTNSSPLSLLTSYSSTYPSSVTSSSLGVSSTSPLIWNYHHNRQSVKLKPSSSSSSSSSLSSSNSNPYSTSRPNVGSSFYSNKNNITQQHRPNKPLKGSLGRPVNIYSNDKIDDFSTESMDRYQSTSEPSRYQMVSSSNSNLYNSWTKSPSSSHESIHTSPSSSSSSSVSASSSFTVRPSIYYTSKPVTVSTSSSSHFIDSWSSNSNHINEVENHLETSWSTKPSYYNTSPLPFITRPRPSSNLKPKPYNKKPWHTSPLTSTSTTTTSTTTTTTTTTTTPSPPSTTSFENLAMVTSVSASLPLHMASSYISSSSSSLGGRPQRNSSVSASYSNKDFTCGKPPLHQRHETRIVGGKNAQFGEFPWQVSVRRTSFFGFSSTHRCGGALLNENWIATAGHCVDDLLTSQIKIRIGEYDFSKTEEPYPYAERSVSKKMVHPKYNFFTYEYDLAMVRLESPVEFAPNIVPICLPGSDDLLIGENATVTGWGRLSEGGQLPPILQKVTVPIVSNEKCRSMFLRAGRYEFISEIFMCAGFDNGGRDSCQGDSGGPLQVKGKDGRYFLAGIISWGIGCAEANLPGVCTRISKFVPWILDTVT